MEGRKGARKLLSLRDRQEGGKLFDEDQSFFYGLRWTACLKGRNLIRDSRCIRH